MTAYNKSRENPLAQKATEQLSRRMCFQGLFVAGIAAASMPLVLPNAAMAETAAADRLYGRASAHRCDRLLEGGAGEGAAVIGCIEEGQPRIVLETALAGERVLDGCAGLGGKSAHMAELMQNRGEIIAVDRTPERLDRLADEMQRLGVSIVSPLALALDKAVKTEDFYRSYSAAVAQTVKRRRQTRFTAGQPVQFPESGVGHQTG